MSTSSRRIASITALSALLAASLTPAVARAAPVPAGDRSARCTGAGLPVAAGSLFDAVQLDQHTTWTYGVEVGADGIGPLLLSSNDLDGRGWTRLPTDVLGSRGRINSVSAVSPGDAWLVGDFAATAGGIVTAHWDGAALHASTAPVPPKTMSGGLLSVSARASDDVWAVGWAQILDSSEPAPGKPGGTIDVTHNEALLVHWDGGSWQLVRISGAADVLPQSTVAVSRNDVWAAGYTVDDQPALLHFDGRAWSTVPGPRYTGHYGEFQSLAVNGPDDVWAVGRAVLDEDDLGHALVSHWDGRRWQQVGTPADAGRLWDVATAPGGIAVIGSTVDRTHGYGLRLTGNRWQPLDSSQDGDNRLTGLGLLWSAGTLTMVGVRTGDQSPPEPLVLTCRS